MGDRVCTGNAHHGELSARRLGLGACIPGFASGKWLAKRRGGERLIILVVVGDVACSVASFGLEGFVVVYPAAHIHIPLSHSKTSIVGFSVELVNYHAH